MNEKKKQNNCNMQDEIINFNKIEKNLRKYKSRKIIKIVKDRKIIKDGIRLWD